MWGDDYHGPIGDEEDEEDAVTCARCGAEHLEWHHTGTRWHLLNSDGKLHVCDTAASADDFEDIS